LACRQIDRLDTRRGTLSQLNLPGHPKSARSIAVNGIVDISSGFEIKVATASSAGRGKVTAFLGTSYKRPRPPLSSAPQRGRELRAGVVRPVAAHEAEFSRLRSSRFDETRHDREGHGTQKDPERIHAAT
jgi:hypothetical protein